MGIVAAALSLAARAGLMEAVLPPLRATTEGGVAEGSQAAAAVVMEILEIQLGAAGAPRMLIWGW